MKILAFIFMVLGLLSLGVYAADTGLSIYHWGAYFLIGVGGTIACLFDFFEKSPKSKPNGIGVWLVVLFTFYMAVRAWVSPISLFAREDLVILLSVAVIYAMVGGTFASSKWRVRLIFLLVLLVLGNCFVSYIQSNNPGFHIRVGKEIAHSGRSSGFFVLANHTAAFFIVAGSAFLARAFFSKLWVPGKLFYLSMSGVAFVAMGFTQSRGGFLALACVMIFFFITTFILIFYLYRPVAMPAIAGLTVFVLLIFLIGYANFSRLLERFGGETTAMNSTARFLYWTPAVGQIKKSPFFGTGSRSYEYFSTRDWHPDLSTIYNVPEFAHNDWLQMTAEYGFVGLGLFLLVLSTHALGGMLFIFSKKYDVRFYGDEEQGHVNAVGLCLGSLLVMLGLAAQNIFEFALHAPVIAVFSAVFLGILVNPRDRRKRLKTDGIFTKFDSRRVLSLFGFLAASALIVGSVKYGPSAYLKEKAGFLKSTTELDKRRELTERAAEADKQNHRLWTELAHIYRESAKYANTFEQRESFHQQAYQAITHAISTHPYDYFLYYYAADMAEDVGEYETAEDYYYKTQYWAPFRHKGFSRHAAFVARRGRRAATYWEFDKAEQYYNRADQLFKKSREVKNWVYHTQHRPTWERKLAEWRKELANKRKELGL